MKIEPAVTLNLLFIGNSFTARNNLPGLVAQLALKRGKRIEHRLISAGGASLRRHWNAGEALRSTEQGGYDYVVLQEQSTLPVKNARRMHESVRLFDAAIKSAGAKMLLYMTWARLNQPDAQRDIAQVYIDIGRELDAIVVPVGLAWERYLSKHVQPPLHDQDQSHPTLAGSYLAACVFYSVLFRESPAGIGADVEGLELADLIRLEKTAWEVCKSSSAGTSRVGLAKRRS
jgi:hypothetical protein